MAAARRRSLSAVLDTQDPAHTPAPAATEKAAAHTPPPPPPPPTEPVATPDPAPHTDTTTPTAPAAAAPKAAKAPTRTKTAATPPRPAAGDSDPDDGDLDSERVLLTQLHRKETRLTDDELDTLTMIARRLNRARGQTRETSRERAMKGRITENTLLRVGVRYLLEHASQLSGTTEDEILSSLTKRRPTS
jgi:hypothetical protein